VQRVSAPAGVVRFASLGRRLDWSSVVVTVTLVPGWRRLPVCAGVDSPNVAHTLLDACGPHASVAFCRHIRQCARVDALPLQTSSVVIRHPGRCISGLAR